MEGMKALALFGLTITFLYYGAESVTFQFKNNCGYTVWPATLSGTPDQLSSTGFELASQATQSLDAPATFSGRFWARTQCSGNPFTCATGDCGSGQVACNGKGGKTPVSLVEITLGKNNGQDSYDVSLVDGFNVPVSISPLGGTGDKCQTATCPGNVNSVCPAELMVKGSNGNVIACKSACDAFNQPQYCCTGAYNTSQTCPPTNYSKIFKNQCPKAYSYAYDDETSLFFCNGAPNYAITFCP